MSLALRRILTLIALVLINSGGGRALHALAAHAPHGHAGGAAAVESPLVAATPSSTIDSGCPQCDMLRAGATPPPRMDAADWASLNAGERLSPAPAGVSRPAVARIAQPRGPPAL